MSLENSCRFKGNLGSDPELKRVGENDVAVLNMPLAINRSYTKKNGEKCSETTWIEIEVWAEGAEFIAKNFNKGDRIEVECTAKNHQWEDRNTGEKRSKMKFRVNEFDKLYRRLHKNRTENANDES